MKFFTITGIIVWSLIGLTVVTMILFLIYCILINPAKKLLERIRQRFRRKPTVTIELNDDPED